MGVTMLKTFAGLKPRECAAAQCRNSRIKQDNTQMAVLGEKIDEFCNPFADDAPAELINIATGQAASKVTEQYLVNILERGSAQRQKFQDEWNSDSNRFLQPLKRTVVQNFAAQNSDPNSEDKC